MKSCFRKPKCALKKFKLCFSCKLDIDTSFPSRKFMKIWFLRILLRPIIMVFWKRQEGAELCQAQPTDQRIFEPDEAMIWIGTWAKNGFGPNLRIIQLLLYWCCPVLPHPYCLSAVGSLLYQSLVLDLLLLIPLVLLCMMLILSLFKLSVNSVLLL